MSVSALTVPLAEDGGFSPYVRAETLITGTRNGEGSRN
jgi:hypothetical protein